MNVLFIARATLYDSPGGDTVQILKTAEELRKLAVTVDIGLCTDEFDYQKYDIVHFFNIIRPADILYHFNKSKRTVISTIFVDYSEAEIKSGTLLRSILTRVFGGDFIEYLKAVTKAFIGKEQLISKEYIFKGHFNSIKYLYKNADALLPNSHSEALRLQKKFGATNALLYKVVNAVEPLKNIAPNLKYKNAIICVGRIERRKNQLNFIKAVKGLDIPCYIIGKPAINDYKYYELCKKEAGSNVFFVDALSQLEIYSIMKAARVHVLPSWFETTGLVSLEAAYFGCNIVITHKGDQEEYFGENAFYCSPESVNSIKNAILKAYEAPFNEDFKKHIETNYTWNQTANQTKQCYLRIMNL
jgi:glycosyltransferase involved in cell wall biosynthesis